MKYRCCDLPNHLQCMYVYYESGKNICHGKGDVPKCNWRRVVDEADKSEFSLDLHIFCKLCPSLIKCEQKKIEPGTKECVCNIEYCNCLKEIKSHTEDQSVSENIPLCNLCTVRIGCSCQYLTPECVTRTSKKGELK
jgi:hypothetical protein